MKCKVIRPFQDKYDSAVNYKIGDIVDWDDQERIADCETRGLIELVPEKDKPKATKKTKKTK